MMLFASAGESLHVAPWSVAPFVALLLCIAILPLVAEHFWHRNLHKFLVSAGLALPVVGYLLYLEFVEGKPGLHRLEEALLEYVDFIVLLAALFTVAGGIAVQGQFVPHPLVNMSILLAGAVLANLIGTTGASMLLIRPFLRINAVRTHRSHLPLFFIFLVSNLGGLLTPLGDPPLFLGFLHGVDFFWTLSLWPHWLVANGMVLTIALLWDWLAYRREPDASAHPPRHGSFVIGGAINVVFLAGILIAVLLQSETVAGEFALKRPWPSAIMATTAFLSWLCTARSVREHNEFNFAPIIEVAVLFIGIFVTMIPALDLLATFRQHLGGEEPWKYFWLTGLLSAFLDNAPTYMTFATLAAGGQDLAELSQRSPDILRAVSAGAVFMGAMTYIGNGPNFMVKSIAEHADYPMPSFFGYLMYSCLILLPTFVLVTWLFFW